jgi:Sushi repeat (SCR repeat)
MCSYAVVSCPPLQPVDKAQMNSSALTYQTSVNISCLLGYEMTPNQTWIVSYCQANQTWSVQAQNCTGITVLLLLQCKLLISFAKQEEAVCDTEYAANPLMSLTMKTETISSNCRMHAN